MVCAISKIHGTALNVIASIARKHDMGLVSIEFVYCRPKSKVQTSSAQTSPAKPKNELSEITPAPTASRGAAAGAAGGTAAVAAGAASTVPTPSKSASGASIPQVSFLPALPQACLTMNGSENKLSSHG